MNLGVIKKMDSVLYAFLWFAIALITVTTMKFAGGWVLLPVVLLIILAFKNTVLRLQTMSKQQLLDRSADYESRMV